MQTINGTIRLYERHAHVTVGTFLFCWKNERSLSEQFEPSTNIARIFLTDYTFSVPL